MKKVLFILSFVLFVFTTCKKEDDPELATLTTIAVTNITINSAESGGVISNDGNSPISSKGIVWGKSSNPTLESNNGMESVEQGISDFKCNLTNLEDNTEYYLRAYATNAAGTAYGNQQIFKTKDFKLAIVDIKQESEWDYFVADKDGNYFFLKESNSKPTKVLLHLNTSESDIPVYFNSKGFPEKILINDYIFIFSNHISTYVDFAVIYPDGKIEVFKNIQTEINWDKVLKSANSSEAWSDVLRWTGRVLGAGPCIISIAAASASGGLLIPLAAFECGTYLIKTTADIMEDEFGITNGFTEFGKLVGNVGLATNSLKCIPPPIDPISIAKCIASSASWAADSWANRLEMIENSRKDKINEANALLTTGINIPTNGLVAYYPFNGNAKDASANGKDGMISGGVISTTDRFGNPGAAYQFNGTDGHINTKINSGFTKYMTICAWINTTFPINWAGIVLNRKNKVTGLVFQNGGQKVSSYLSNASSWLPVDGKTIVTDGKWHLLTSVISGTHNLLYIDGVLDASIPISSGDIVLDGEFFIGQDTYSNARHFKGKIDDVRIYNRALTDQEIQSLYKE